MSAIWAFTLCWCPFLKNSIVKLFPKCDCKVQVLLLILTSILVVRKGDASLWIPFLQSTWSNNSYPMGLYLEFSILLFLVTVGRGDVISHLLHCKAQLHSILNKVPKPIFQNTHFGLEFSLLNSFEASCRGWRDGSAIKNIGCFCRSPGFSSQHPLGG